MTKEQWSLIRRTLTVYISLQILDESGGIVRVVQITLPDGNNGWVAINPWTLRPALGVNLWIARLGWITKRACSRNTHTPEVNGRKKMFFFNLKLWPKLFTDVPTELYRCKHNVYYSEQIQPGIVLDYNIRSLETVRRYNRRYFVLSLPSVRPPLNFKIL